MTKPLSHHWADIAAARIINQRGQQDLYTLASGITPSGVVHIGNFREVITVDLVARSLRKLDKKIRFIYSWDNFDTFRKVPKNLPNPKEMEKYLRQSIARIPDPWKKTSSYAKGRMEVFENELSRLGINPEYLDQEKKYSQSDYSKQLRCCLENTDKIKEILNKHRTTPLSEDWLPTVVYCSVCKSDDIKKQSYKGNGLYVYECNKCSNSETIEIDKCSNLKLIWRLDWPMRWAYEKVDFEPGGKDHSSEGGSYSTGKELIESLWGVKAPIYLQYDFVMMKGGSGKMSSSTGELITLTELLSVYEPEVVRWIFANHRPNHDFSIALDEDVIKIYEEFDRGELKAYSKPTSEKEEKKHLLNRRTYELSLVDEEIVDKKPLRPSFRLLANRLQICNGDFKRVFEKFYKDIKYSIYESRAKRAWYWVGNHAPEELCYRIRDGKDRFEQNDFEKDIISRLRNLLVSIDLETITTQELNELIWEKTIKSSGGEAKDVFKTIYRCLIKRDKGPRLPGFLKEIGKDKLLELLL
jgi:lysyl-tRNA synthetase, class I